MTTKPGRTRKPTCAACRHPDRHKIEMLRVAGLSLDALAAKFNISRDSIFRHMSNHVSAETRAAYVFDAPVAEMASRAAAEQVTLLDYLSLIRSTLIGAMLQAASLNDRNATANLAGRAVDVLREIGKLTGEVSRITSLTQHVTFASTPAFGRLYEMLFERLGPWPEALASVLDGLPLLDGPSEPAAPALALAAPQ